MYFAWRKVSLTKLWTSANTPFCIIMVYIVWELYEKFHDQNINVQQPKRITFHV